MHQQYITKAEELSEIKCMLGNNIVWLCLIHVTFISNIEQLFLHLHHTVGMWNECHNILCNL